MGSPNLPLASFALSSLLPLLRILLRSLIFDESNFEVYSLKNDSWKTVSSICDLSSGVPGLGMNLKYVHQRGNTSRNDKCYWFYDRVPKLCGILSFDMSTEVFESVKFPCPSGFPPVSPREGARRNDWISASCFMLKDSFVVMFRPSSFKVDDGPYEIWGLLKCGVAESWTKLFTFEPPREGGLCVEYWDVWKDTTYICSHHLYRDTTADPAAKEIDGVFCLDLSTGEEVGDRLEIRGTVQPFVAQTFAPSRVSLSGVDKQKHEIDSSAFDHDHDPPPLIHCENEFEKMSAILRRTKIPSTLLPQFVNFASRSIKSFRFPGEPLDSSSITYGIHVFQCPDARGIVAKLSDCIASRGGNILGADIFVPENKEVFYSRSEFIFDHVKWPRAEVEEDFLKLSKTFNAARSVVRVPDLDPKYKIAILASKQASEHCLTDMLHVWQAGKLPVEIVCVISNHERGENTHVIRFLERNGIPYHYVNTTTENKREEEILNLVQDTDFLVLARYMQILSGNFLRSYGKDVINIHHGLLPSFKGGFPSKQAFDAGVKLIGATSHFVTEELDAGPIIEQMVERVTHRDNLRSFIQKSENLEKQCLAKAIKSYCELRVLPYEHNKTVVF
ncbi:Formyltetrahydrofolate deformylase 1, mitochondrial [Linum perenne]